MARRQKDNFGQDLLELFMRVPSWLCIPIAVIAFLGVQVVARIVAGGSPILVGLVRAAPLLGGGLAALVLFIGFKAAMEKWSRRRLLAKQSGIESVRQLSWSAFERLIGEAYRQQGYEVEETGQGGADGGIDLELRRDGLRAIVQCKQWKAWKVGVKPVRELYGVMMSEHADRAIFVTSGQYTAEAVAFARGKPIALLDGVELEQMIARVRSAAPNEHAAPAVDGLISPAVSVSTPSSSPCADPVCSLCGSEMVLRTAKRGARVGSQFWGCSTYPSCKGIQDLHASPQFG